MPDTECDQEELVTAPEVGLRFWHDLPILNEAGADVSRAVTAGKPFGLSAKRFWATLTLTLSGDPYGQTRIGS